MENNNSKQKVFSGLVWKFGERITAQLVSLIVSVILARILLPSDYGAIELVMIFITIANVFVSNGFGKALVQKRNADNLDFSSVFYINIALSILLYLIIFIAAPLIARFYNLPIIKPTLRVLGIRIIVAGINSIQHAYVERNMLFRRFFWSTLFGTILSGAVGVSLAYYGYGVWALVAQYMTNTCTDTIVLWFTVKWRPELRFSWKRAKELLLYGWKILVSALLDTGYIQLRSLIIGKIYLKEDLAYYNHGDRYPSLIVTNVNNSISSVLFPALSDEQNDIQRVKNMTRRAIQISSYVMWPMMVGLAVCGETLIHIVLTDKWLPCVPYLQVFCFSYGLWPIHTANLQAINAIGRSDIYLKLEIIKKTIGIVTLLATIHISPYAIAISLLVSGIISTFINAYPNTKLLDYTLAEQLGDLLSPLLLSLVMGVVIYFMKLLIIPDIIRLLLQFIIGITIYIFLSIATKQKSFHFILNSLHSHRTV